MKANTHDTKLISVTFFDDQQAQRCHAKDLSLQEIAALIRSTSADKKDKLPWIKLGIFGDKRSKKNCLRTNANVLKITGVELDYDGKKVSIEEGIAIATKNDLRSLFYTTASYKADAPKWRALVPTSRPLPPQARKKLAEQINKMFGSIFTPESFVLSQSYYFGYVGTGEGHRAEIVEGMYIDELIDHGFHAFLAKMGDGDGLKGFNGTLCSATTIYAIKHGKSFDQEDLKEQLREAIKAAPKRPDRPPAEIERYLSDKYLDETIESAVDKFGADEEFETTEEGHIKTKSQDNIRKAIELLGIHLRHDSFHDRMLIEGLDDHEVLDDAVVEKLWLLVDHRFKFLPVKEFFFVVVKEACRRNSFHPVRDYLNGLQWDGVPRIDKWLTTYGKAKDTPYVRAVSKIMLLAAVRRIRHPSCKFDELPTFESPQGTEKSSALAILAVEEDWFRDDLPLTADSKKVIEQTQGRWIVEIADLSGMGKADIEHLKASLSRRVDHARLAYGRLPVYKPREFVPIGSTNEAVYLKDLTGNRRYWPVLTPRWDLDALKRDRDQLWAEAVAREVKGESIRLDRSLWPVAAEEQRKRTVEEPWIDEIANVLGDRQGKIISADVWKILGMPAGQRTQEHNRRFGFAMRSLNWRRKKLRFGNSGLKWGYWRGNTRKQIEIDRSPCSNEAYIVGDYSSTKVDVK